MRHTSLDGLRGLAIFCVLTGHAGLPLFGGSLIMFVLSGFLITSIMLREYDRSGTINRARFYQKRFLRLIPALAVMLVLVNVFIALTRPAEVSGMLFDTLLALLSAANWSHAWSTAQTHVLPHLWSLSIEQQFYLAWPFALIALCLISRRAVIAGCLLIALGSWGVRVALVSSGSQGMAYLSTVGRLDGLMIGAALAALLTTNAYTRLVILSQRYRLLWHALIVSAGVILSLCLTVFSLRDDRAYTIGMTLVSGCTALIILACVMTPKCWIARGLSLRALVH